MSKPIYTEPIFTIFGEEKSFRIVEVDVIDSTNDYLKRLVKAGEKKEIIIRANYQRLGRGQFDRSWESAAGENLLFSFLLFPDITISKIPLITSVAAFSVLQVLTKFTQKEFSIKKPNDVLFEGKKIAGILTEQASCGEDIEYLIVGMGINILATSETLPENATSLYLITNQKYSLESIFHEVIQVFYEKYVEIMRAG